MALHLFRQNTLLMLVAMLEEFLNNVISEDISRELKCIRAYLSEDLVLVVTVGILQLLLDESRAVLITTEFDNMVVKILRN